jgi:hypothetical protein
MTFVATFLELRPFFEKVMDKVMDKGPEASFLRQAWCGRQLGRMSD